MRRTFLLCICTLLFSTPVFPQVSPNPVADNEIRDGTSIRRRSMELERVKRESWRILPEGSSIEQKLRFEEIKANFESIQKLQSLIVKTYTTGEKINYLRISDLASELTKKAVRLDAVLFESKMNSEKREKRRKQPNVRDLIVDLDKAIGNFVDSPIFKEKALVNQKMAEKSQNQLEQIITLSDLLSKESKKAA